MSGPRETASDWTEVRVHAPLGWQELVGEELARGTGGSTVLGCATAGTEAPPPGCELVRAYLPAERDTPRERAELGARLARLAEASGAPELAGLRPSFRALPPEDYATSWKKVWKPFRVGTLAVVPPWRDAPLRPGDRRMLLEPGAVFGSGRHATTRTVLRLLQARVRAGDRIVDAGAGSGILGVAALVLGAGEVFGFDVDPASAKAAAELAGHNGVAARARFATGDFALLELERASFDGACANIYHDVLCAHARDLARVLRPGAWFLASGCSREHATAVARAFAEAGLEVQAASARGRWVTFAGRRAERD